ncbi:hypothetical protein SeLEV6574_g02063 [Synchytrium endobioticum]|nr:hypothetical protein SeLEV6574_g02063 [Synchytrium endobioticum]
MDFIRKHPAAVILAIAVSTSAYAVYSFGKPKNKSVPGPSFFSRQFLKDVVDARKKHTMHALLTSLCGTYGPIVRLPPPVFGLMEVILLTDAPESKRVLTSKDEFDRTDLMKRLSLSPHALPALTGAEHRRHRKILQPAFGPRSFRQVPGVVEGSMQQLFAIWGRLRADGHVVVDASVHMKNLVVEVLGHILFGHAFGMVDALERDRPDRSAFDAAVFNFGYLTTQRAVVPKWLWASRGLAPEQVGMQVGAVLDMLNTVISNKRAALREQHGGAGHGSEGPKDFIDFLLSMDASGDDKFTHEEIVDECVTFYLGAQGTTPGTLGFLIYELCKNPALVERLQAELDEELGADGKGNVAGEFKSKLLHNMVLEALRLHPSFNPATRVALRDTTILGHHIRKGTNIRVFPMGLHTNPASWVDPLTFDPDRWDRAGTVPGSFLPFGDGVYHCIGKGIAQTLLKTITACLLYHYSPRLDDPNITVKTNLNSTSIHHLMVEFVPRRSVN